jgi:predicted MFS family arabinose efflux permease
LDCPDRARFDPAVLSAGCILSFVLGSVHAFSVFLEPLEALTGSDRAEVSLTYSLALVAITVMVTFGHRIYGRAPGWLLCLVIGFGAVLGAGIAAATESIFMIWVGYGVIFGTANGLGYGYALQLSAQANPGREGFAMGLITAAYALGATVFAPAFQAALPWGGFTGAMLLLCTSAALAALTAALLLWRAGTWFQTNATGETVHHIGTGWLFLLWLAYGTAVSAGLMATGHATGIAEAYGTTAALLVVAPMIIALCNMFGSLIGGWMTDRVAPRLLMTVLPIVSAVVLLMLALDLAPGVLGALGVVGLVYGAVISVYPASIARWFGVAAGVQVYGIVFTAWAVAGFGGPWLAGALYDSTGGYATALLVASGLGIASFVFAAVLPRRAS